MKNSKKVQNTIKKVPVRSNLEFKTAVQLCKENAVAKFDETIEIAVNLGVDPRHADQIVRGVVSLPHGTGKEVKVLCFCAEDRVQEALDAGADYAGLDEYVKKINDGWVDMDVVIATPDMMGKIGRLGKVLGPRGLMPNPKSGTVTQDIAKAIKEVKAGKIDFRTDKKGIVHAGVGKASFGTEQLSENILEFMKKIMQLRPAAAKGTYLQKVTVTSTMGLGYDIDRSTITALIG